MTKTYLLGMICGSLASGLAAFGLYVIFFWARVL